MISVGTAELRNRLSRYLRSVQHGERIVITDHGKPIAELVPFGAVDAGDFASRAAALAAEGALSYDVRRPPRAAVTPVRLSREVSASDLVSRLRDE